MSKCNLHTEVYSRVTGYFRPTKFWNKGKLEEYKDRKTYLMDRDNVTKFDSKINKNK